MVRFFLRIFAFAMPELCQFTDTELGAVNIRINSRARHLILRIQPDGTLLVTVPPKTPELKIREFLDLYRPKVKERLQQLKQQSGGVPHIDWNFRIDASFFRFQLECGGENAFQLRYKENDFTLLCPPRTDFQQAELQTWIRKVIEEAMRRRAKSILPMRIEQLSARTGLSYHSLKINTSKGRWGSCSTRRDINLSCSLMLLPEHLIDYVILHELCHTVEMNHSPRFWALLDRFTGNAHALRHELRKYHTFF